MREDGVKELVGLRGFSVFKFFLNNVGMGKRMSVGEKKKQISLFHLSALIPGPYLVLSNCHTLFSFI